MATGTATTVRLKGPRLSRQPPEQSGGGSGQGQLRLGARRFVVDGDDELDVRADLRVAHGGEQFASGALTAGFQVSGFPVVEARFRFRIGPGPARRRMADAASPRLGGEAGAEAVLGLAELAIKRVG